MIAKRRGEPGARYFQQYVADSGAYLRDVDGLGDGFAPSLYCHERDWLNADRSVTSGCKRRSSLHHKQNCKAKTTCSWKEKTNECREKSDSKSGWPTGDALFRDHFECFLAPPFDEWFGFDALPPADDPAWGRRAVAETYAAVDRDAFVDCGAADGELRVVVHVRLGDLIHPDLSAKASAEVTLIEMRSEGGHLRNALRVVAALRARLPGRRVHTLILSDSPPETVAATLEGLDVGIHVGGARRDGASHLVDGRTVGLENDFDINQATQLAFDVATKGKRLDKLTGFTMFDDAEWVDFFAQRTARGDVAVVLTQDDVLAEKVVNASAARGVRIVHVDAALRSAGLPFGQFLVAAVALLAEADVVAANSGSNMGRAAFVAAKRDARGAPAIFDLDGKWTAEDAARGYAPCKLQYFLSSTQKRDDCGHSGGRHPLCLRVC
ncbi:hypothetical protein JL721_6154 [Aureococcus anophagefferens]|nr:hypothetical protein JL721_6154 [Aureococcus anophagefferens]